MNPAAMISDRTGMREPKPAPRTPEWAVLILLERGREHLTREDEVTVVIRLEGTDDRVAEIALAGAHERPGDWIMFVRVV